MGGLFCHAFRAVGRQVAELDRDDGDVAIRAALKGCDLAMLCVPVTAIGEVVDGLLPHLSTDTVLCDVGSVKILPIQSMLARFDGPVVGTHPLFGAVVPDEFEPKVAVTPGRESDESAADAVTALMENCGYSCFRCTAEEHDRAMAFIQGLNFASSAAFLAAARDLEGIENFVTPSFNRRLESARKMLTQDTELFEVIAEANPFLQETNRKFMSYLSLAAGGDLDLLADRARWWWRDDESH